MARASTKENKNIYQTTREGLRLTREAAGELLAVGGREDMLVPAAHREEIAALNDGWVSVVYDGADHTFNVLSEDNSIALDCIEMTAEWFSENL